MATQPERFTWSPVGAGAAVDAYGVVTATHLQEMQTVLAESGSVRGSGSILVTFSPPLTQDSVVTGRHIFYNNSVYDGYGAGVQLPSPGANNDDDDAIATDKVALLPSPGTGPGHTATFANYTSYSKGLNGVMFDLSVAHGDLNEKDLVLRVGDALHGSTTDPIDWKVPATPTIATRNGDPSKGETFAKRVTLIWPDGAIKSQWLRVAVLPSIRTGLAAQDVFFFGNLPGDTGYNNTGAYITLASDRTRTQQAVDNPSLPADILSAFDHNRDGVHTVLDVNVVWDNLFEELYILTAPVA